jgi:eukaryotic-like serine/threonine-protein kinase
VGALRNLTLSPDQRRFLGDTLVQPLAGSWMFDLERNVPARVSTEAARQPHWSPDGTRIAFTVQRGDVRGIYVQSASHVTSELLLNTEEVKFVNDWTDDGRYLVFVSANATTKQDLWILPTFGDRQPQPFLRTPDNEVQAQVSPDGQWIAYASDESGRLEVYVDSFPTPGAKMTISNGGGGQPQWRGDGQELFYLRVDGSLMAVDVRPGTTLQVGPSRPLFRITLPGTLIEDQNLYAVSGDGLRFLVTSVDDAGRREPITVLANWTAPLVAQASGP